MMVAAAALVACSGNAGTSLAQSPATPQGAAEITLQSFMQAVADSNLVKMAELWGTAKGSAARTKEPSDYERRIVVMQAYLRNLPYRILSNTADGTRTDVRILQVGYTRDGCEAIVPVTVVQSPGGWVVNSIDLSQVGSPGRQSCKAGTPQPGN